MRLWQYAIIALLAFMLAVAWECSDSEAHHNGAHLPGDPATYPVPARVMQRGYVTYCFNGQASSYPNFVSQMAQVRDAAWTATGFPSYEVPWSTDPNQCDVRNEMVSDADFPCKNNDGTISAAACIYYWGEQQRIFFRRNLNYGDWKSADCHEGGPGNTGHASWIHEHYDDVNFRSLGRTWTCMDFGTGTWATTAYDRDRIWEAYAPDAPAYVGLVVPGNGYAYVTWDRNRKDGGAGHVHGIRANTNAHTVSFAWSATPSSTPAWVGEWCGPEYGHCAASLAQGWQGFHAGYWSGCLWLHVENALWWLPQRSAPNTWTLAGCFGAPWQGVPEAVAAEFNADGIAGEATCIAWAESTFNALAVGGVGERGVMQIHPIHEPELWRVGATWAEMFEPGKNARYAAYLRRSWGSWSPWSTAGVCGV